MPGGDRSGPFGMGPMTGRGAGFCGGGQGRFRAGGSRGGWQGGRVLDWGGPRNRGGFAGRGRGWGWFASACFPAWARGWRGWLPFGPDAEKRFLDDHVQQLEQEIAETRRRIDEIESASSSQAGKV
jgi:hypothetical protein